MMISDRPEATASSTTYWIIGLSTSGSISFGCAFVAGRNRVPRPAAGKTALRTFMISSYAWRRGSRARAPSPHALQHGHDRQDARGLDQDEHRLVRRRVLQQDRREAERRGEEEEQQHALLLGEPQLLEAMVDVVPARVGEPLRQRMDLPRHDAREPDEADVEEGHAEDEQRREQRDERIPFGPFPHHREAGEGEADERGAAVAEKDLGTAGTKVVRQEAEARAHQRGRQVHEIALLRLQRGDAEEDAGDDAEAGGEPVHAVEELDRVGHRDEPEDRQAHVQPREAGHPVGRDVEDDTVGDRRDGGADVTQELEGGPEIGDVVQNPDRGDERRPDGDSLELEREVEAAQHGHRERAVDGRSAEKRRRDVVHLPGGRHVEHAPPQRKRPDEWRGEERDRERERHQIEPRQTRGMVPAPDRREQEQPHQRQTGQMRDYCSGGREAGLHRGWPERGATRLRHARPAFVIAPPEAPSRPRPPRRRSTAGSTAATDTPPSASRRDRAPGEAGGRPGAAPSRLAARGGPGWESAATRWRPRSGGTRDARPRRPGRGSAGRVRAPPGTARPAPGGAR